MNKMHQRLHRMYHEGVDHMAAGRDHEAVKTWIQAISMRETYNAHPASKGKEITGALCSCVDESANPFKASHIEEN